MRASTSCPDRSSLQQFLLGRSSHAEAEAMERHLEGCDRCLSTLQELHTEDSVIEALRSGGDILTTPPSESMRRLAERLKALRAAGNASSGSQAGAAPVRAAENAAPATGNPAIAVTLPATDPATPATEAGEVYGFLAPPEQAGVLGQLGPYHVLKVLGTGGMGVVFQAYDPHLERMAAVKAMLPALAANPSARQRFLREARAAAAIKHDHIVTIYQVGEDRGTPFLAMELLEGESLDDRLGRERKGEVASPLPLAEILRIGREIAEGLAAAHKRGLIHRDVKPGNVWLEVETGRVKILDFGLVRAANESQAGSPSLPEDGSTAVASASDTPSSALTQAGAIVGTPAYMAPEQAYGRPVDARSDLFSLGCVLYRMATGTPPFQGQDTLSTLRAVCIETPASPRGLAPTLPAPLSDLIIRLLAKKAEDRPPSAQAVVETLRAIERECLPALAGGRSPAAALRRIAVSAAVVLLLAVLGGGSWLFGPAILRYASGKGELVLEIDDPQVQAVVDQTGVTIHDRATDRRYQVKPGRHDLKAGDYEVEVTEVGGDMRLFTREFTITRGGRTPVRVVWETNRPTVQATEAQLAPGTRGLEVRRIPWEGNVAFTTFAPDGRSYLALGTANSVRVWDVVTGELLKEFRGHTTGAQAAAFTPDGKTLLTVGFDGTLRLWDVTTGREMRTIVAHEGPLTRVSVSPDGRRALTGSWDKTLRIWDLETGQELSKLEGHSAWTSGTFTADGKQVLSFSGDEDTVRLWDVATGKTIRTFKCAGYVLGLSLLPDARQFLAYSGERQVQVWDLKDGGLMQELTLGRDLTGPNAVAVCPDGRRFLGCHEGKVIQYDLATGDQECKFSTSGGGGSNMPRGLSVSPDGRYAACGSDNGIVYLWRLPEGPAAGQPSEGYRFGSFPQWVWITRALFSRDGRRVLACSPGTRDIHVLDVKSGKLLSRLAENLAGWGLALSPDGNQVFYATDDHLMRSFDVETGKEVQRFVGHTDRVDDVAVSPDGRLVVTASADCTARLWEVQTGKEHLRVSGHRYQGVAFAPDGRTFAAASTDDRGVRLFDVTTGKEVRQFTNAGTTIGAGGKVGFSPDGTLLVVTCSDSTLRTYEVQTGKEVRVFKGYTKPAWMAVFSSDGRRILSGGEDGTVRLWDAASGKQLAGFGNSAAAVTCVDFSPDGLLAVSSSLGGGVRLWRLSDPVPPR